jgi:hypothetical protein
MVPRWLRFTGLTLLLGFAAVPAARADTRWSVSIGVGAPRVGVSSATNGYDRYRYRDDRRRDTRGRWDRYQGRDLNRDRDWREHDRGSDRGDRRR